VGACPTRWTADLRKAEEHIFLGRGDLAAQGLNSEETAILIDSEIKRIVPTARHAPASSSRPISRSSTYLPALLERGRWTAGDNRILIGPALQELPRPPDPASLSNGGRHDPPYFSAPQAATTRCRCGGSLTCQTEILNRWREAGDCAATFCDRWAAVRPPC